MDQNQFECGEFAEIFMKNVFLKLIILKLHDIQ